MFYYLVNLKGTDFADIFESQQAYKKDHDILVESERGLELATIKREMHPMESMGSIISYASAQDIESYWHNLEIAESSAQQIKARIQQHKLEMKLLSVHYNMDRSKVFVQYLSDKRIDFRDLLRDLSQDLKTRIELKQLGARDYAQMIGCLGSCGREGCCSFKRSFESITIHMARNQMLTLKNESLTGTCGSLKCCLAFENDMYTQCKKRFPKLKSKVNYQDREYTVLDFNCISEEVLISNNNERLYVPLSNLKGA